MNGEIRGPIAVCGATGRQGGAVARSLLGRGWSVRALTRRPRGKPAQKLANIGAEIVRADMMEPASLHEAFAGAHGVFSVQNGLKSGFEREVVQRKNVADVAEACGVNHLVYGSAGTGEAGTGIDSWEAKLGVEEYIRKLGLRFTVLRPMAFMELMTDKSLYPAVGTWNIWPKLMGEDRPVPWMAVKDLGEIAAIVFDAPDGFAGKELILASDIQTLAECRSIYEEVRGRPPRSSPMPEWLFDLFTRKDLTTCGAGAVPARFHWTPGPPATSFPRRSPCVNF